MPIGGRWFSLEVVELLGAFLRGRDPKGFLLVVVEVGGVPGTLALRDKGSFNLKKITTYNAYECLVRLGNAL